MGRGFSLGAATYREPRAGGSWEPLYAEDSAAEAEGERRQGKGAPCRPWMAKHTVLHQNMMILYHFISLNHLYICR